MIPTEKAVHRIGSIRILGTLGEGGMGTVFVGYDERLERRVAVKSLRYAGISDAATRARLLQEARILSRLDHPNICRIHELVETEDGEFLILELIDGETLERRAERPLGFEQQLDIAIDIASALSAAHAEGVVHRDLKPQNVMLTADGTVKVLDFGVARSERHPDLFAGGESTGYRATAAAGDETVDGFSGVARAAQPVASSLTVPGSTVGTPRYMSPEQARGEPTTPASDVYSFGLLLQELATGKPARDPELNPRALADLAAGGGHETLAGLDRDLGTLVAAMLALAPGARPTAIETRDRLRRIRGRKRRRLRRGAVVLAFLVMVAGVAKYTLDLRRERSERAAAAQRAEREAENARQVTRFLVDLFELSDPDVANGESITARQLLDQGADRLASELEEQPLVKARLLEAIGVVYQKLALYDSAEKHLGAALALREHAPGTTPSELAESWDDLADLRYFQGRYPEAIALYRRALPVRERELGAEHPDTITTLQDLGDALSETGQYAQAEAVFEQTLALRERVLGPNHPDVAVTLHNLAILALQEKRNEEALALFERDLAITEKHYGPDHPEVASSLSTLSVALERLGRGAEALAALERALAIRRRTLPPNHPRLGTLLANLATHYRKQGNFARAAAIYEEALPIVEGSLGARHPNAARIRLGRARLLAAEGDRAGAIAGYVRELAVLEESLGPDHPELATILVEMGDLCRAAGRETEATVAFHRALAIREKAGDVDGAREARARLDRT